MANNKDFIVKNGLTVGNNITVSGTVDGRNISTDGSKLDGIEVGATADQTASEILTLIKTVDGSGSGLDADTLDGIHASGLASNNYVQTYVASEIAGLVDSAPTTLDTLNELAAALGDDANFSTTVTNSLATKASNNYLQGQLSTKLNSSSYTASDVLTKIKTVDGSGSGLDADLLDGAQPSVSASNDTIVKRHSSGYIFANYFNTTPNDVSSGVTKVLVETGNDGYMRHGTQAAIRNFIGAGSGNGLDADTLDGQHGSYYAQYDHFRSLGTTAFTGTNTTAGMMSEIEGDGGFDSYTSAFKTSWSYAGNFDLSDGGSFGPTETAGMSFLTWTDNSSDTTRGNITVLAIAPTTGGSAGGVYVYNDQGSTYSPGWREIWTSSTDGSGSGLDADLLDGIHASGLVSNNYFQDNAGGGATGGGSDKIFYNNDQTVTTSYTIPSGQNSMTAGPISINSGVTVTVPSGSEWTIV